MGKPASDATLLRQTKSNLAKLRSVNTVLARDIVHWTSRAIAAEREAAEWKKRFDTLLNREPTK